MHTLCAAGGGKIDEDTYVDASSIRAALHASGAACDMVRALVAAEARGGFRGGAPHGPSRGALARDGVLPVQQHRCRRPGAISELGVRRVFILDWDVHHGNGTAEIFDRRDDVLCASIHQGGIYPGGGGRLPRAVTARRAVRVDGRDPVGERVDCGRVELCAGASAEFGDGVGWRARRMVSGVASHRVVGVGDG